MDGDGKQDLALRTLQGLRVYKNVNQSTNHFIQIEAQDRNGQTVEGSLVTITAGDKTRIARLTRDGSFNAQVAPRVHFGLGQEIAPVNCTVRWPNGMESRFANLAVDQRYRVQPGLKTAVRVDRPKWVESLPTFGAAGNGVLERALTPRGTPRTLIKKDRVTVINLWAPWCEPCKDEMPHLDALSKSESSWLDVVGLGVEPNKGQTYADYFKENQLTYTLLMADKQLLETIFPDGKSRLPTTLVYNREGRLVRRYGGSLTKAQLDAIVAPLKNFHTTAEDYVWKSEMAEQEGDQFAAYLALKDAVKKAPKSVSILVQAAYSADRVGAQQDAVELVERAVQAGPKSILGWRATARLLSKYGGAAAAQARVERAPDTLAILILKSELAGAVKNEELALKLARQAEKIEPDSPAVKRRIRWLTDPEARKLDLRNIGDSKSLFE